MTEAFYRGGNKLVVNNVDFETYVSDKSKGAIESVIGKEFNLSFLRKIHVLGSLMIEEMKEMGKIKSLWKFGIFPHHILVTTSGKSMEEREKTAKEMSKFLAQTVYPVSCEAETKACMFSVRPLIDWFNRNDAYFRELGNALVINVGGSTTNAALIDHTGWVKYVHEDYDLSDEKITHVVLAGIPSVAATNMARNQTDHPTNKRVYETTLYSYEVLEVLAESGIKENKRGKVKEFFQKHNIDYDADYVVYITGRV